MIALLGIRLRVQATYALSVVLVSVGARGVGRLLGLQTRLLSTGCVWSGLDLP